MPSRIQPAMAAVQPQRGRGFTILYSCADATGSTLIENDCASAPDVHVHTIAIWITSCDDSVEFCLCMSAVETNGNLKLPSSTCTLSIL